MKTHFLSLTAILAFATIVSADDSLTFGSKGTATEVKPNGNNTATLEMTEDSLTIESENFWTVQAMIENAAFDLGSAGADEFLEIEVQGAVSDKGPKIRVVLASQDFSRKYEYLIDVSELDPATAKTFKSTTPLSKPVPAKGETEEPPAPEAGTTADRVIFITEAEEGNQPWQLEIKGLKVVK